MSELGTYEPSGDGVNVTTAAVVPVSGMAAVRRVFMGDDGLRAGWSFLLFGLLLALITFAATKGLAHTHLMPPPPTKGHAPVQREVPPRVLVTGEGIGFGAIALAALLMSLIERRPFSRYGFALRRALPDFVVGLFWGFVCLSLLIGLLLVTNTIQFEGLLLHGVPALAYAAKWGVGFLFVGLLEEFLFRGYMPYTVARGISGITRAMSPGNPHSYMIGFAGSAFLFSIVLFALTHTGNHGETALGIFAVALAGGTLAFAVWRTGTLWWAVGWHTAWDWAQSYFYGTADSGNVMQGHLLGSHPVGSTVLSGGTAGPEGSVLVIPTLMVTCLIIHFTLPYRERPLTADQGSPRGLGIAEQPVV